MTCMETAFPSVDETCKNRVTIACTGVAGRAFFQWSITRRDRGDT